MQPPGQLPYPFLGELRPRHHQGQVRLLGEGRTQDRRGVVVGGRRCQPPRHRGLAGQRSRSHGHGGHHEVAVIRPRGEQSHRPVHPRGLADHQYAADGPAPPGPRQPPRPGQRHGRQQAGDQRHDGRRRVDGRVGHGPQDRQQADEQQPVPGRGQCPRRPRRVPAARGPYPGPHHRRRHRAGQGPGLSVGAQDEPGGQPQAEQVEADDEWQIPAGAALRSGPGRTFALYGRALSQPVDDVAAGPVRSGPRTRRPRQSHGS